MSLAHILQQQVSLHGPNRLQDSLGDGFLYRNNRVYRRLRLAVLKAGFQFSQQDPGAYFGFPLLSLPTVLATRTVPYRNNVGALAAIHRSQPGRLRLSDLKLNRPVPNYLLHESAHAVGFSTLWKDVRGQTAVDALLGAPESLPGVMLCEAFAMTAEYLAACHVGDPMHRWYFSINSYRHTVPGKQTIGWCYETLGRRATAGLLLGAFLYGNYLRTRLSMADVSRIATLALPRGAAMPDGPAQRRVQRALSSIMRMNPDFVHDTARLFLRAVGHTTPYQRLLKPDPLDRVDTAFVRGFAAMTRVLA